MVKSMAETSVFSKRLTELREEKGLKRQEVADALEISRASLEYYEKGQRKPDIEVAARIAQYYGVSTDYLVGISAAKVKGSEDEVLKTVCDYLGISENAVEKLTYVSSIGFNEDLNAILSTDIITVLAASLNDYYYKTINKEAAELELSELNNEELTESYKRTLKETEERLDFEGYHIWNCIRRELDKLCRNSTEEIRKYIEDNNRIIEEIGDE